MLFGRLTHSLCLLSVIVITCDSLLLFFLSAFFYVFQTLQFICAHCLFECIFLSEEDIKASQKVQKKWKYDDLHGWKMQRITYGS
jgi:hypothetical protein